VALLAATALAATNLTQKGGVGGCVTEDGLGGQCQNGRGLVAPAGIALSPDGANAYVAASSSPDAEQVWHALTTLVRDSASGTLRPIDSAASCFADVNFSYDACLDGRALKGAEGVAVSPDGENVYVASRVSDAVAVFDRDPETGLLTQSSEEDGCVARDLAGCASGRALDGARSVAVSPDGNHVYVASKDVGGGVAIFGRDEDGDLTQPAGSDGCVSDSGSEGCAGDFDVLTRPEDVELSPDGEFAYVASRPGDAIYVFSRNSSDGSLNLVGPPGGCVNETGVDGCGEAKALGEPVALAFDPSGQTLYAAAERAHAIVVFDRDDVTGTLSEKPGTAGCVSSTGWANPMNPDTLGQCQDGIALYNVSSVAVSPDGAAVYASTRLSDGIAILERHADGTLTQRPGQFGCITETGYEVPGVDTTAGFCRDGRALGDAAGVAVGPDSLQVYGVARQGGVTSFDVVPPPAEPPVPEPVTTPVVTPPPRDRSDCKRVIRQRRKVTGSLQKALRNQSHLRRRLDRAPDAPALLDAVDRAHRRVKRWRRARHLLRHRERRLCK
jgi:DNA-binding beta-propeller fold protein YncE